MAGRFFLFNTKTPIMLFLSKNVFHKLFSLPIFMRFITSICTIRLVIAMGKKLTRIMYENKIQTPAQYHCWPRSQRVLQFYYSFNF